MTVGRRYNEYPSPSGIKSSSTRTSFPIQFINSCESKSAPGMDNRVILSLRRFIFNSGRNRRKSELSLIVLYAFIPKYVSRYCMMRYINDNIIKCERFQCIRMLYQNKMSLPIEKSALMNAYYYALLIQSPSYRYLLRTFKAFQTC